MSILDIHTDNPFLLAALGTIGLLLLLIALGILIRILSDVIVRILAGFFGSRFAFFFRNYFTWAGTVHHEFSHTLFAILTGAKVIRISLLPHGDALGQVDFIPRGKRVFRSLQLSLSAIAPVICGLLTELLLFYYIFPECDAWWQYVLLFYLAISILFHMTLSRQDMKNLLQGLLPTVFVLYLIFLVVVLVLNR